MYVLFLNYLFRFCLFPSDSSDAHLWSSHHYTTTGDNISNLGQLLQSYSYQRSQVQIFILFPRYLFNTRQPALFIWDLVPGTYSTPGNQLCLFETWIPGTYSTPGNQLCLLETWSQVLIQHPATSSVYWRLGNKKNTHEAMIRGLAINYL